MFLFYILHPIQKQQMSQTFNINLLDDAELERLRHVTDPLADETITAIISSGYEAKINEVFMTLVSNDNFDSSTFSHFDDALAKPLDQYFKKSSVLPDWADCDLINQGEKTFSQYGPEIFMLLNVSALPMCYTCAKGAHVLFRTGRLLEHNSDIDPLARRLMETAQMIMNVLSEGGLATDGKGIVTIQKVRLIHASIRYYLKHSKAGWDESTYGEPINQEDLAGTLMSFGPVILNGLLKLGTPMSETQKNAYMHCWKVVGFLMGIDEKLLPDTYEQGFELANKILKHQAKPSEEGTALTQSCINFINYILPGNAFDKVPVFLMDYFLSSFTASSSIDLQNCIGVKSDESLKDKIVLSISRILSKDVGQLEKSGLVQQIIKPFNNLLLRSIIHHYNYGKSVHFFIPPSLQSDWGISNEWVNHLETPSVGKNRLVWQKQK